MGKTKTIIGTGICIIVAICLVFGINYHVKKTTEKNIITSEEAVDLKEVDCIIVLGCRVYDDGTPSNMLKDRLTMGIELYNSDVAPKLLMSGDHGRKEYNEVGVMKKYATKEGIASSDVFMDHAGFSTYESIYRAKEIFEADKAVIVTQRYHLYRALYIADKMGIDAYGVASDYNTYPGQAMRELREVPARLKDFGMAHIKAKPSNLGEAIPVSGNGDITND